MSAHDLPEWPKVPDFTRPPNVLDYLRRESDAYRARMEALADVVRDMLVQASCFRVHHRVNERHASDEPCLALDRISALLAACERREG